MKRGYSIELLIVDAIELAISKSELDLNISIGGNGSKCMDLMNYLIKELEILGNSGRLATGRGVIEKWLSKNSRRTEPKKEINYKNKDDNQIIQDALNTWTPVSKN